MTNTTIDTGREAYCELVRDSKGPFYVGDIDSARFSDIWPKVNPKRPMPLEMIYTAMSVVRNHYRKTGEIPQKVQVWSGRPGDITVLFRTD